MKESVGTMRAGSPWPFGVQWVEADDAFNFSLYSRHATGVTLLCYTERTRPDRSSNFVSSIRRTRRETSGTAASRRASFAAPRSTPIGSKGRTNRSAGTASIRRRSCSIPTRRRCSSRQSSAAKRARSAGRPTDARRWAVCRSKETVALPTEAAPRYTCRDAIVYELHVKGFTARANSGVTPAKRGTFAGVTEKIPYLKDLGVTIVELLPVQQFDPQEGNYWGYMTLHFFSPHQSYAHGEAFEEFRDDGAGVPRGGHRGVARRGLQPHQPKATKPGRPTVTAAWTTAAITCSRRICGTTSTIPAAATPCAPAIPARACSCSKASASGRGTMGVDGFRFDLASIFSRAADGTMNVHEASLVSEISLLARLFNVRLVAEAWDIGSYQLGRGFPGIGVAAMERQVSRRRAFVRARRAGQGGRPDAAALWQRRSLSRRPARNVSPAPERQLPHRARRLLPLRPGGLRSKTQRGQRPRQHRRHRTTT